MPTIREYLQGYNPELSIRATTAQSTYSDHWESVEGFEQFTDFNNDNLESLYGDVLDAKFEKKDLPEPNELLPIERTIFSERELDQDPVKRSILLKVNYALIAGYAYLTRKDHSKEFKYYPTIVCGTKEPSGGPVPDWLGYQTGMKETFLCGETKLSTVFAMQKIINDPEEEELQKPFEQCMHYCIIKNTRYGYIITDEELVVFRIRNGIVEEGLAAQRPRRTIPTATYSDASSSLNASMQGMSVYSDSKPQSPRWIQYCVIKWNATKGLTVCTALFWLTLMAYAPTINVDINNEYEPLNRWEWDAGEKYYRNNTSGRVRASLSKRHIELVDWEEGRDAEGKKYFASHLGSTYVQQLLDEAGRAYYYDNHSGESSWVQPKGNVPKLLSHASH
jgi:hypothetical protein